MRAEEVGGWFPTLKEAKMSTDIASLEPADLYCASENMTVMATANMLVMGSLTKRFSRFSRFRFFSEFADGFFKCADGYLSEVLLA